MDYLDLLRSFRTVYSNYSDNTVNGRANKVSNVHAGIFSISLETLDTVFFNTSLFLIDYTVYN